MPTKRTRIARGLRQQFTPESLEAWLAGDYRAIERALSLKPWETHLGHLPEALWAEYRDELLALWVTAHLGTRPPEWWEFDAPRSTIQAHAGEFDVPEPRQRLGGTGTPKHEALAYIPQYDAGIPVDWVDGWEVAYYSGLALDVHGQRIGAEHRKGPFTGVAIDPKDPPVYEAQATYLERHGLLFPGERRRLRKADFEPEAVLPAPVDEDEREDLMRIEPLGAA
jgi:hypothetical protein